VIFRSNNIKLVFVALFALSMGSLGFARENDGSLPLKSSIRQKQQDKRDVRFFEVDTFAYHFQDSSEEIDYEQGYTDTTRTEESKLSNFYSSYLRFVYISRERAMRLGLRTYGGNEAYLLYGWRFSASEWGTLLKYTWSDRRTRGASGSNDEYLHDIDAGLYAIFYRQLFDTDVEYGLSMGGLFLNQESKKEGKIASSAVGPGYFFSFGSKLLWPLEFWKKSKIRLLTSFSYEYQSVELAQSTERSIRSVKSRHIEIVPIGIRTRF